jgi:hypothetical protein
VKAPKGWKRSFDDPITLPNGRELRTLRDAADYIMKLPRAEQKRAEWQTAGRILIGAAEGRDFLMHVHIAIMQALNRHVVPTFKPLSVLRYLNQTQNLGCRLDLVLLHEICTDGSVDVDKLVDHLDTRQPTKEGRKVEIARLLRDHAAQNFDLLQITNGRDFLAMLGLALQDKLGERKPSQASPSEVEIHFRLSFSEEDFVNTKLYFAILNWQSENKPYIVLKSSLLKQPPRVLH